MRAQSRLDLSHRRDVGGIPGEAPGHGAVRVGYSGAGTGAAGGRNRGFRGRALRYHVIEDGHVPAARAIAGVEALQGVLDGSVDRQVVADGVTVIEGFIRRMVKAVAAALSPDRGEVAVKLPPVTALGVDVAGKNGQKKVRRCGALDVDVVQLLGATVYVLDGHIIYAGGNLQPGQLLKRHSQRGGVADRVTGVALLDLSAYWPPAGTNFRGGGRLGTRPGSKRILC